MDETQRMLGVLNTSFPDIASMAPLEARAAVDARINMPTNLDDVASAADEFIDTDTGAIRVRVYRAHSPNHHAPTTVFAHGGGFLHGSIEGHDGFCRRWSRETASTVVSVQYRLAPDATAPAAVYDLIAAVDGVGAMGIAPAGIIVAGDSAGANLAAVTAIAMRDRGESPIVGQVLIYPMLDPRMDSETYRTRAEGYFVTARLLAYYWDTYLGIPRANAAADWRICPLAAASLEALPPAIIVTAGLDPLCAEGGQYADRLRAASTATLHRHHPDQFHGFLTIPGYGPGLAASDVLFSDIRRLFTSETETP